MLTGSIDTGYELCLQADVVAFGFMGKDGKTPLTDFVILSCPKTNEIGTPVEMRGTRIRTERDLNRPENFRSITTALGCIGCLSKPCFTNNQTTTL